jgi:hypothetical protein
LTLGQPGSPELRPCSVVVLIIIGRESLRVFRGGIQQIGKGGDGICSALHDPDYFLGEVILLEQWKQPCTRRRHLLALGADLNEVHHATRSRKGYWLMSQTSIVRFALSNRRLEEQGFRI